MSTAVEQPASHEVGWAAGDRRLPAVMESTTTMALRDSNTGPDEREGRPMDERDFTNGQWSVEFCVRWHIP